MKKITNLFLLLTVVLIVGACTPFTPQERMQPHGMNGDKDGNTPSEYMQGMGGMGGMPGRMNHHGANPALQDSSGKNELQIPPILEKDKKDGQDVYYTIEAKEGETEIFPGKTTKTLGYNGDFLGPVIRLQKGETAHFTLKNKLNEETTFHWHGLVIDGEQDGGPHEVLEAGEERKISFDVSQEEATLWFHPHPLGKTAKQVYEGLAGLIYIEEEDDFFEYGENDIPLIFQDRLFTEDGQLDYLYSQHPDGTVGNTLLINGTINPKLTVNREKVRLRLLNGSNKRDYTFKLSNGASFTQIASDGGRLVEPLEVTELKLTPAERAEIIVDFSAFEENEEVALQDEDGVTLLPFVLKGEKDERSLAKFFEQDSFEITEEEKQMEPTKEIVLSGHGHHVSINGKKYDPERIDFTQKLGETEVWEVYNKPDMMGGMLHPFHIHGTQFKVISINGEAPPKHLQGYKDTIDLNPGDRAKIAVTFDKPGVFMFHCHILEHEENGMMGQILVE